MPVPVMDVGKVRVRMNQWLVPMRVAVGFAGRVIRRVDVLMMLVVMVQMFVLHRLVPMLVFVALGQV